MEGRECLVLSGTWHGKSCNVYRRNNRPVGCDYYFEDDAFKVCFSLSEL